MNHVTTGLLLLSLVTVCATPVAAQGDFHWKGKIAAGLVAALAIEPAAPCQRSGVAEQ